MQLSSLKFLSFVFGCKNHSRVFVLSSSIHESTWRRRRFIFLSTEGHHKKHLVGEVLTDGRLSFSKLTTPFCAVGLALRKNICEKSGSSSNTKTVNKKFRYPRIFRTLLRLRMIKVHRPRMTMVRPGYDCNTTSLMFAAPCRPNLTVIGNISFIYHLVFIIITHTHIYI